MAKSYKIYPSIGLARIGNSETEHYLAPDSPQQDFVPPGGYRDKDKKIKRMGQTFRIYEYEGNKPLREITAAEADIVWEVELRNSKAAADDVNPDIPRDRLICKSKAHLEGPSQRKALNGTITPTGAPICIKLGDIYTNDKAQLVVLGGHGKAGTWNGTPPDGIRNSGWWDDTSDGPVRATLQLHGSDEAVEAERAWVIVGVADFAHANQAIVTLYDLARDRSSSIPAGAVSFTREIFPLLQRTVLMQWVHSEARNAHAGDRRGNFLAPEAFKLMHDKAAPGGNEARKRVFEKLKSPSGGGGTMPALSGLTVTELQYKAFKRWADGEFTDDWNLAWDPYDPPQPAFADIPIQHQPDALNQAALGSGIGGSFNPGIEAGSRMAEAGTYERPFHISRIVNPGDLTCNLGIPWQADFEFCKQNWWPSARPGVVAVPARRGVEFKEWTRGVNSSSEMVAKWQGLGFIVKEPNSTPARYVETERTLPDRFTLADKVQSLRASEQVADPS